MGFIHAPDGGVSPEQKAYLVERAKGGFGIVYPSAHTVTDKYESTESSGNFLCNYSQAARLAQAVEQIHQYGAKFAIQLTPGYGRVNVGYPGSTEHDQMRGRFAPLGVGVVNVVVKGQLVPAFRHFRQVIPRQHAACAKQTPEDWLIRTFWIWIDHSSLLTRTVRQTE